jgi:hypothetical protein
MRHSCNPQSIDAEDKSLHDHLGAACRDGCRNPVQVVWSLRAIFTPQRARFAQGVFDSFNAQSKDLCLQYDRGGEAIQCGIADVALRGLIDFRRIKGNGSGAFRALLPEIERLANAKCDAGRLRKMAGS